LKSEQEIAGGSVSAKAKDPDRTVTSARTNAASFEAIFPAYHRSRSGSAL